MAIPMKDEIDPFFSVAAVERGKVGWALAEPRVGGDEIVRLGVFKNWLAIIIVYPVASVAVLLDAYVAI
ncbi:hypothetical protein Y032_0058g2891 [Ancylostoma ceylanicum]|uniref:Uncharacterized protein n=1 Tax=Ancylostoma ceylanicum TaxID=53326 RepID=A0A016U440_9BILA|nr:hypothetical protein Y032_0058g2891 [Ancylostoma ceylanicum]